MIELTPHQKVAIVLALVGELDDLLGRTVDHARRAPMLQWCKERQKKASRYATRMEGYTPTLNYNSSCSGR